MRQEDKNRFDALSLIWTNCWARIDERRQAEWRLTITFWTALAATGGLIISRQTFFQEYDFEGQSAAALMIVLVGGALIYIHYKFLKEIGVRHSEDRMVADDCFQSMLDSISGFHLNDETLKMLKKRRAQQRAPMDYSRSLQLSISALLVVIVTVLCFLPSQKKVADDQEKSHATSNK